VRSPPERVEEKTIATVVAHAWRLPLNDLRYFPEGGGAYHWFAGSDDGRRWFVTCDDLAIKPWLGADHDVVFDGLLAAYGAAIDLRAAGLSFVAAPVPTASGAPAARIDARHSVSLFEHVDGEPGQWGRPVAPATRTELVSMLGRMHQVTPAPGLDRRGLDVPGRDALERALGELDRLWDGGPLSDAARHALAAHDEVIAGWLAALDRFTAALGDGGAVVVTHGEPHPGNLIHTAGGLVLVDWDTVALARPERDLWMIADADGHVASTYGDLTGVTLDAEALAAYRLLWALADLAAFTTQLREEHRGDADGDRALTAVRSILAGREPAPYGAPRDVEQLLASQRTYYDLRAPDYADVTKPSDRKVRGQLGDAEVRRLVDRFAPSGDVLEMACGSGVFTRDLVRHARALTALDGSPQMLDRNRGLVGDPSVEYVCADLFEWRPHRVYDAVFFGFWLSHVPPTHFDAFWSLVGACVGPGGRVGFVDEDGRAAAHEAAIAPDGLTARRTLSDGRAFDIVKVFWDPVELTERLHGLGWRGVVEPVGESFLYGVVEPDGA